MMSGSLTIGHGELLELDEQECLRRLSHGGIGRVCFVEGGFPLALPMNYVFTHGCAWVRTGDGTLLAASRRGAPACLEIDGLDPMYHGGWDVVARGMLDHVTADADLVVARSLPLTPWVRRDEFVRLVPAEISGRRLRSSG